MAQQTIINTPSGGGDTLKDGADKINANFTELYAEVAADSTFFWPIQMDMSFWTRDAGTTNLPPTYYGLDARVAVYRVHLPFRLLITKIGFSVSALIGSGAVRYGVGIADMAGTVLGSGMQVPTANDFAVTLSGTDAARTVGPGSIYVCFGGRQEVANLSATFRRCFRPNYTNFGTGMTIVPYGYATNVIDGSFVFPTTLGTLTALTNDTYYFPQLNLIG